MVCCGFHVCAGTVLLTLLLLCLGTQGWLEESVFGWKSLSLCTASHSQRAAPVCCLPMPPSLVIAVLISVQGLRALLRPFRLHSPCLVVCTGLEAVVPSVWCDLCADSTALTACK